MSSSAAWQLAFGLIAVLCMFVLASGVKRTIAIGALLILIPFQVVDTRYASSSVLIAYALATVLLLNGGLKLRMLPAMAMIVFAYLASLALGDRELMSLHLLFLFQFFSCLIVFLLAYNFAILVEQERSVVSVLLAINILVVGYCVLQLSAGAGESFVPFGFDPFEFNSNRDPGDPRLIGPFANPGSTAGYFTLMTLVCAVELVFVRGGRRLFVQALVGLNLLGLVATGNRTGFLILMATFPIFLLVFRRELGARRIMLYLIGGLAVVVVASAIAITYTDFGRMFSRLESVTETEGGVPTTRAETWPIAIEKIKRHPWFGEGPYFWTAEDAERMGQMRVEFEELGELDTAFDPYPHSLYLYLLRTIGVFGLIAVVGFFLRTWFVLYGSLPPDSMDAYRSALVRLGLLLIPTFLVAQITLEFNRPVTMDYAQFIFALMGLLVGVGDRSRRTSAYSSASQPSQLAHGATVGMTSIEG